MRGAPGRRCLARRALLTVFLVAAGPASSREAVVTAQAAPGLPSASLPSPDAPEPAEVRAPAGHSESEPSPIDIEMRRALDFLRQLELLDDRREKGLARESVRTRAALETIVKLQDRLDGPRASADDADRLYDAIVAELKEARPELRSALAARSSPSGVPRYSPGLELPSLADLGEAARIEEVRTLRARIAENEARLREQERAARWSIVEQRAGRVQRLNALRLAAIGRLSSAYRARLLGVSREGIDQLRRELEQVELSARYYAALRGRETHRVPGLLRDAFALGTATYVFLRLAGVLSVAFYLRARGAALLQGLRRILFRRSRGVKGARWSSVLLEALSTLAPWTLFLLTLQGLRWALGAAAAWRELDAAYRVALLYGFYRLAIDALYGFVLRVAHRYRLTLDARRRDKLLGTARTLMRVLFAIAALRFLSEELLGRGYLYHLVQRFAWAVVLLVLFRILVGWQAILVESYLTLQPRGRSAAIVRATRDRWYGVFVAAVSLVWLVAHALVVVARDFALGFDQTRRAMAFFFRRRVEKQAERQGYSEGEVEALPQKLIEAFVEEPVSEDRLLVDNFPGMDLLRSAVAQWRDGAAGGGFLVTGERGIGKTTWLRHVQVDGLRPTLVTLATRLRSEAEVTDFFSKQLGHSGKAPGLDDLARRLAEGEERLVLVDLCQNLFLGTVGGYQGLEAFTSLVEASCRRVFWVCAINTFAWEHLAAVRPELGVFRFHQALPHWSEAQIRELILTRTAASGVRLSYDDLMVGPLEGVSGHASLLETEEGYTRLLWDYSDGNPRVAVHFWLRSLVPESAQRARVRLCKMPPPEELQRVGEAGLFLLASIMIHENLSLAEATSATRYPEPLCRMLLGRFLELGALKDQDDRYRVTTHWHRAAVRLLKRLNLLPD